MKRKFTYLATTPTLPDGATSPVMDCDQMTSWLNDMADQGWEFVGYGQKWWQRSPVPQEWWIFRRPHGATDRQPKAPETKKGKPQ